MNNVTAQMEAAIKDFTTGFNWIQGEVKDIYKAYFSTDASTLVSALASGTDGASLTTKLTKTQYTNAITLIEQLKNFFDNASVTQADYWTTLQQVKYGNAAEPAQLSAATEDIANRIKVLFDSLLAHFAMAKDILSQYSNSEMSVLVANLDADRTIYGASMNNEQLGQGVTLVEQFKKMINNEAVTAGLYSDNLAVWLLI